MNILKTTFEYLPSILTPFKLEILSIFYGINWRYEYKKSFEFDLLKDNIDDLFEERIVERGKKYLKNNKVLFLEKIDNRYFSVVNGSSEKKYVVIIEYDEENKKLELFCDCPCEFYCKHIYAVFSCIKEKYENRFFKIMYKNPNVDLYERIMNFDYLLCTGIVENNFEIINSNGKLELMPILDRNWEVLEDDDDRSLSILLNEIYINEKI